MASIEYVTLEVADPTAADGFGWEAAPHHGHDSESPRLPAAPVIEQR